MFVCVISGSRLLQPAQVCDMLKGLILVLCFSMMHYVDYSMMYHLIRGQSVIKLYIIYNMLEVPHTSHTHLTKIPLCTTTILFQSPFRCIMCTVFRNSHLLLLHLAKMFRLKQTKSKFSVNRVFQVFKYNLQYNSSFNLHNWINLEPSFLCVVFPCRPPGVPMPSLTINSAFRLIRMNRWCICPGHFKLHLGKVLHKCYRK